MGIAKSVAKWTSKNLTELGFEEYVKQTHTSEIQRQRGKKSSGGGRPKVRDGEWISLGISRSTWYRKFYKNEN